ncbi:YfhO family protein [Flavobacteriaceae bacterium]|nr:YfhO family protein [Flavobacteriaceae bacterium]MDB2625286.1 YfhO family protein [Flavobacteriaceae bacterium]
MNLKFFSTHLVSLLIFIIAALLYFHPVLKGEKLSQSDITQHIGMAKEVNDYRTTTGLEPYWAESAFSGMPTYQIGTYFPHDYLSYLDRLIRFLPRPADYLFLYFLGFYVLLLAFKVDWKLAIMGSLAFGFSTYLMIIFGAGHNAKAHAIAYMPLVIAGVIYVFKKQYLLGFTLTGLATALEIKANHPQMTYYLLFAIFILGIIELIEAIKKKQFTQFTSQSLIIITAMLLAVGVNSTRLMATKEYSDFSTRGNTELTMNSDGTPKEVTSGLSKDYITQFSYGISETFNLLVPRYMGGGTVESLDKNSNTYKYVSSIASPKQAEGFTKQVYTYWGDQLIVEAPAYIGAVIIFLFFLGIFLVKGKFKHWLVASTVFSILMSWGKNFELLTNFFIDYIPLYNKFRAVSSFQVIAELCIPLLGILAIKEFIFSKLSKKEKLEAVKKAFYVTSGLIIIGLFYAISFSTFEGLRDANYSQYEGLLDAVIADRKSLLYSDSFRSLVLISVSFSILWLFLKQHINKTKIIIVFTLLILFDLVQVNLRYVNDDDFRQARKIDKPFRASSADLQIQKDKSHYRVANFTGDPFQDGRTSYFHKSIGGYHAAKMGRYQDLIEFQLGKQNMQVYNMLNVKYFIIPDNEGKEQMQQNPNNNGNSWFIKDIKYVKSANEEIKALDSLNTKTTVVINEKSLTTSVSYSKELDSLATINLVKYSLNALTYDSNSTKDEFAVFSEIYYKNGWNAYIDGELKPHLNVNYVLRGLEIPAGKHSVEFRFEPKVIQTGSTISLLSYVFLLLIPLGWFFYDKNKATQ